MYKLLLCWKYLRTRYLALVCIVSVMLGVATLIVVNSVMSGFSTKLRDRLHGVLSDVVIESRGYNGFPMPADEMMRRIANSRAGQHVAAMTPTIEVFAMMQFRFTDGQSVTRPVHLMGIDAKGRSDVGGFAENLVNPANRADPSFRFTPDALRRFEFLNPESGQGPPVEVDPLNDGPPPLDPVPSAKRDPKPVIIGWAIGTYREKDPLTGQTKDNVVLAPGDTVNILTVGAGKATPEPVYSPFVVSDYFKSEMAEYDSNYVYVPLDYLQRLRAMDGRCTHVLIRLKDYEKAREVVNELRSLFPGGMYVVSTWEDKQGALLAAIDVERGILNLLLFLIIGVAGFGILAIFSMIVFEKTRDIGILKSLGASNRGVMSIFLTYGLLLGLVGALLGTGLGLAITEYINELEKFIAKVTQRDLFPRDIYYFDQIPTNVQAWSVVLVNLGAVAIAVLFSILPALRAAMLHPVRALRYE